MGELISIAGGRDPKPPIVICPHCKNEIQLDITAWKDDVTKVMQDKCPKCLGTLMCCMLILTHKDVRSLMGCVQAVTEALGKSGQYLG